MPEMRTRKRKRFFGTGNKARERWMEGEWNGVVWEGVDLFACSHFPVVMGESGRRRRRKRKKKRMGAVITTI